MDTSLSKNLLNNLENQIKQTESEVQKKKESVLLGIECKMEGAVNNLEIASLDKKYEKAEKEFEQEQISHKRKTVKNFVSELDKLTKHIKKVNAKELENK